jgi:hypothetical protein
MSLKRISEDVVGFQLELVSLGLRTFGAVFGCVERRQNILEIFLVSLRSHLNQGAA